MRRTRILVLGGTGFIGRHLVESLLDAGHAVSVLSRGATSTVMPDRVEYLFGNRDEGMPGLRALGVQHWDACVDLSGYTPTQVHASASILRDRVGRYVYMSAVSVYGDPSHGPVAESFARVGPAELSETDVNATSYGPLKVACEDLLQPMYADRCTILRPQIVVGPFDGAARLATWVARAAKGNDMLAPGDGADFLQFIDVRDVARFTRTTIERNIAGTFNLAGHRITWAHFLALIGARLPVWVSADLLAQAQLSFVELPMFRPTGSARSSLMHVSNERACAAGLTLTDMAETIRHVEAWCHDRDIEPALSATRERELIAAARALDRITAANSPDGRN